MPDATLRMKIHHGRPKTMELTIHQETWAATEEAKNHSQGKARGSMADEGVMKMLQQMRMEMKADIQELKGKSAGEKRERKTLCATTAIKRDILPGFAKPQEKVIEKLRGVYVAIQTEADTHSRKIMLAPMPKEGIKRGPIIGMKVTRRRKERIKRGPIIGMKVTQ